MAIDGPFKTFLTKLSECTGEDVGAHEGVSAVYSDFFRSVFKTDPERVHGCDGYWRLPAGVFPEGACMLTEYKFGRNLKSKLELSKVLAQCVYYIHKFVESGEGIPKVVCVADENESVFLSGEVLWKITGKATDFSLSPSNAAADEKLLECLLASSYIENLFVFDMDGSCDLEGLVRTIVNIASAGEDDVLVEVTEHNIDKVWLSFKETVFGKKGGDANEQVSVFVHYITDHEDFIMDDAKGKFSLNGKTFKLADPKQFKAFRRHFGYVRSIRQRERLRATCDRFIEDMNRRKKGEFYTPTAFVDYAHKMIAREFGENWKEEYVVWDCAWGTGNLTRDYKFKELYCSTLEQAELDIAAGVNPEATKFQYDFLNDEFEKLPEGLQKAFREGRKILFLINPPYGTSVGSLKSNGSRMQGSETMVSAQMKKDGLGVSSKELYGQFLYRIVKLAGEFGNKIDLALFCKPKFLTGSRFTRHREMFLNTMEFAGGFIFNASHFMDVSASWGITLNFWRRGETENKNEFPHTVLEFDGAGNLVENGVKALYNTDGNPPATSYWKNPVRGLERSVDVPSMNNALRVVGVEKLPPRAFGAIYTSGTSCSKFPNFFYMLTGASSHMGNAVPVMECNARQCCDIMAAVRLAECNWLTDKDELLVPDTTHPAFAAFSNDALVFSTFNGIASSLRAVEAEGRLWDIKNEFFWMGADEMLELADSCGFESLYRDAEHAGDRFVFRKLQELDLSPEATAVLEKASEIVRKSFKYRKEVHEAHPEYHLNAWDAGWYQIKKLVAELPHMKSDMDEFKALFKALGDKMRPMVYELGFLKK